MFGLERIKFREKPRESRHRIERLQGVLAREPSQLGLGIDESTAVVLRGDDLEVVGESYVLLFSRGEKGPRIRALRAGDRLSLQSLR